MSIAKYLSRKKEEETRLIQVKVPASLRDAVNQARREDKLTMLQIVIAGLKLYLEERGTQQRRVPTNKRGG